MTPSAAARSKQAQVEIINLEPSENMANYGLGLGVGDYNSQLGDEIID